MGILLDWTGNGPDGPGGAGDPTPCRLCGNPTICRSPKGVAVHKTCAESYFDSHPDVEPYESRRRRGR